VAMKIIQCAVSCRTAAILVVRFVACQPGSKVVDEGYLVGYLMQLLVYPTTFVIWKWPRVLNPDTLDLIFCVAHLWMVPFQLTATTPQEFALVGRFTGIWCLAFAAFCNKLAVVLFANLLITLCRMSVYANTYSADLALPSDILMGELMSCVMITALAHRFHSMSFELVHRKILDHAVRQESGAMTRLLDLMTDVVVEMNADLRIMHPSPKLAAMLTLGTSLSVVDMRLDDFMPISSDQERFHTLANGLLRDESAALPSVMHTTLRGPHNSLLQVEILCAIFPGIDGAKRLLAGLREVADRPAPEVLGQGHPGLRGQDERGQGQVVSPPSDRSPASSRRSSTSSRRRRTSGRGTPSASPRRPFGAEAGALPAHGSLHDPCFLETSRAGRELSILHTMTFWNCKVPDASCCAFHSYLGDVAACCSELSHRRCAPKWRLTGEAQCQECGIMAEWVGADADVSADGESHPPLECDVCLAKSVRRPRNALRLTL